MGATANDSSSFSQRRITDWPYDWDTVQVNVTQDLESTDANLSIDPTLSVTAASPTGAVLSFEVCVFYVYRNSATAEIDAEIGPYTCGHHDQCVWFDSSSGNLMRGANACNANVEGFDDQDDAYGCCENAAIAGTWTASMSGVDDPGVSNTGIGFGLIVDYSGQMCSPYVVNFSF